MEIPSRVYSTRNFCRMFRGFRHPTGVIFIHGILWASRESHENFKDFSREIFSMKLSPFTGEPLAHLMNTSLNNGCVYI